MKTEAKSLDADEFRELNIWFQEHSDILPVPIRSLQIRLLDIYSKLTADKKQQKKLLAELNKLMGLVASSEKGSNEKRPNGL